MGRDSFAVGRSSWGFVVRRLRVGLASASPLPRSDSDAASQRQVHGIVWRRGTRGRIVSLSLSQRHAASESEAACDRRPAGRPLGGPYDAPHQGEPFANH